MAIFRATCTTCGATSDLSADRLIVELPSGSSHPSTRPSLFAACPVCGDSDVLPVSWIVAAQAVGAGAATVTAPDEELLRPAYPEQRPDLAAPMSLDDLIDLHAALEQPFPA